MTPVTIVSCYYNIRNNDQCFQPKSVLNKNYKDHADYLKFGIEFLKLPFPTVLFIDPSMASWFRDKSASRMWPTFIVPYPFENLPIFTMFDQWQSILGKPTDKYTAGYYILVHSKTFFMKQAINMNVFNTEYFMWLDFGITYITDIPSSFGYDITDVIKLLNNQMRISLLTPHALWSADNEQIDKKKLCLDDQHYTSAQIWLGDQKTILEFIARSDAWLETMIDDGDWICLEEKFYFLAACEMREKINPSQSTYTHVLYDFLRPTNSWGFRHNFIEFFFMKKDVNVLSKLIPYLWSGFTYIPNPQIQYSVLDCCMLPLIHKYPLTRAIKRVLIDILLDTGDDIISMYKPEIRQYIMNLQ